MKTKLTGKTALITGGAQRIGKTIALALAQQGVNCLIHYLSSSDKAEITAEEIRKEKVTCTTFKADFSDIKEVFHLLQQIKKSVGIFDFLINNASVFPVQGEQALSDAESNKILAINAIAPFILAEEFAKQTSRGCIINILDTRISYKDPKRPAYQASKKMLEQATWSLAKELAPGIRVNGIAPGLILPPENRTTEYLQKLSYRNLLGQPGTPEDIAQTAVFLLSNSFITGEILYIDGGERLKGVSYE